MESTTLLKVPNGAKVCISWETEEKTYELNGRVEDLSIKLSREYLEKMSEPNWYMSSSISARCEFDFRSQRGSKQLYSVKIKQKEKKYKEYTAFVPFLTPESIALEAAKSGLGDDASLEVIQCVGGHSLIFRKEYFE